MDIKNLVIGIAIFVLTMFVVVYGISTFYSSPEYSDFCDKNIIPVIVDDKENCEEIGGKWNVQDIRCVTTPCPQGYCERDFTCRQDYDGAREDYSRTLFLIAIVMGLLLIVLGAFLFNLDFVGGGLMAGGVGTIIYGTMSYWQFAYDWFKFSISLVGLVILIGFAYWFNKRIGKKK